MENIVVVRPINILLADDHQIILDGICGMLVGDARYKVAGTAGDGTEAIAMINANPTAYDVLITDISMPLCTGIELCKMVKASHPEILILVLSMHSSTAAVQESIMAEADGYLLKSSGRDELLKALGRITAGGTYFSEAVLPIIYKQYKKDKAHDEAKQKLSQREHEVLHLIMEEKTSEEIGRELFISRKTVENHRAKIMEKTSCTSTIGLVKWAIVNGIE